MGSLHQRSRSQAISLIFFFFYVTFSNATFCCDNWNTFLQRNFKLGQNVWSKILVKLEYGSSGGFLSVQPHFFCATITGILFYRELSNFVRMFVWARSWSTSNMGHLSVCLSVHPHFLCAVVTWILFYGELSNFVYG